ncbi:MAG: hypothetical protein H0X02_09845 [Nitrosomonas sp.]|nr:hypothetical protein [Nitrosomonas sp.]
MSATIKMTETTKNDIRELNIRITVMAGVIIPLLIGLYIYIYGKSEDFHREIDVVKIKTNALSTHVEHIQSAAQNQ